jgi:hypothetical protein
MRRALRLAWAIVLAVVGSHVLVVGLALTPLALARQYCYRVTAYCLLRFKWAWRDERPVDISGLNRAARRRAASSRGPVGFGYRGRR